MNRPTPGCGACPGHWVDPENLHISDDPIVYVGVFPHRQALIGRCRQCRQWWEMPALAPVRSATLEDVVAWFDVGDFEPNEGFDPDSKVRKEP